MTSKRQRVEYKKWLYDSNYDVPRSTQYHWRQQQQLANEINEDASVGNDCQCEPCANDGKSITTCDMCSSDEESATTDLPCDRASDKELDTMDLPYNADHLTVSEESTSEDEWESVRDENEGHEHVQGYDDHNSDNNNDHNNFPLYFGSQMNRRQLLTLVMAYALKHHINAAALRDLLTLLNAVIPGALPKSCYLFNKDLIDNSTAVRTMYYCSECGDLIGNIVPQACKVCQTHLNEDELQKKASYFITISLADQLREMLECRNMLEFVTRQHITSLSIALQEFLSCLDNVSLSCNIDGVPVFKSSQTCIWPIFVTINELPIERRSEFIILHSLWFGKAKPRMETYLVPLIDDLKNVFVHGVQWKDGHGSVRITKCALTMCVCDSVARPLVQNMKQFNGRHGCGFCLHEGKLVAKGNGRVRVYPVEDLLPEMRNSAATTEHAELACSTGTPHLGVKGPCALASVPHFDIINGFTPDYMHAVCLGVVRQVVELCLSSAHRGKAFYLGGHINEMDRLILLQHPPSEITRVPRSFSQRKFWKASEWRAFLLFYSPPVFSYAMTAEYFNHWLLLVYGVHMLMSDSISINALEQASRCFIKFVVKFRTLYGEENVSFNVHLLLHLCSCASIFGNLQRTSAFVYEDACGRLLKAFHGTQAFQLQMVKNFLAQRKLYSLLKANVANDDCSYVSVLFSKLCTRIQPVQKARDVGGGCTVFGVSKKWLCSNEDMKAIEKCFGVQFVGERNVERYERFCLKHNIYSSTDYARSFKRDNSYVCLGENKFACIKFCCVVSIRCNCLVNEVCNCSPIDEPVILLQLLKVDQSVKIEDDFVESYIDNFIFKVNNSTDIVASRPSGIYCKCVAVTNGVDTFVVKLPKFESD